MVSKAPCVHRRTLFSDQRTIVFPYKCRTAAVLARKIIPVRAYRGAPPASGTTGANSICRSFVSSLPPASTLQTPTPPDTGTPGKGAPNSAAGPGERPAVLALTQVSAAGRRPPTSSREHSAAPRVTGVPGDLWTPPPVPFPSAAPQRLPSRLSQMAHPRFLHLLLLRVALTTLLLGPSSDSRLRGLRSPRRSPCPSPSTSMWTASHLGDSGSS